VRLAKVGLAVAFPAFALTFRGPRSQFWSRMTTTGAILGTIAMAGDRSLHRPRVRPRDVALGVGIAAGLYAIFQVGDRLATTVLPAGEENIGDIYELRTLEPQEQIAARLAAVIGPAEELFWRGLVQRSFAARWGGAPAAGAAALAYGGAHLVTGNPALIGAASVAGLYWSLLAWCGAPMASLIVSHVVWDIWIFLVAPTRIVRTG
jgi:uncharacterized protein